MAVNFGGEKVEQERRKATGTNAGEWGPEREGARERKISVVNLQRICTAFAIPEFVLTRL